MWDLKKTGGCCESVLRHLNARVCDLRVYLRPEHTGDCSESIMRVLNTLVGDVRV